MPKLPFVSIIVPCYNEETTILHLLDAVLAQTYPRAQMELVISDGMSTDLTRDVVAGFQKEHADLAVRVVENSARTIPSGLNQAIRESRGEIIVRLDAHSMPIPEYVERCVAAHEAGMGDNVGGVWEIRAGAPTWVANAISFAAAHPLGVGDAMYRLNAKAGAVDTVPFGSFRRSLIEKIGAFDETLLANEDYEFNTRVRESGGTVWLDPSIRSVYFSRSTFGKLASSILALRILENENAATLSAYLALAAGIAPAICIKPVYSYCVILIYRVRALCSGCPIICLFFCAGAGWFKIVNQKKYRISFTWASARDLDHAHNMGHGIFVERNFKSFYQEWLIFTDPH